ncbi:MAG: SDR family NAD(P)-dependent oxidoreductase [Gammaproteobacteria bacterium]
MNNKVIILTGGSRGLGQSFIEMLLQQGEFVATCSRDESQFIKDTLASHPSQFYWESVDISDYESVARFVRKIYKMKQGIDVLINNAAIAKDSVLSLQPIADIDASIDINLKGSIYFIRSVLKYFLAKNKGQIINISSIVGQHGYSGLSVYSATKAGIDGLTRSLARELGQANIRINSIAPGYLETSMSAVLTPQAKEQIIRRTPLGRLGTTDDILGCVNYLLSDASKFITGQIITIDGGINC